MANTISEYSRTSTQEEIEEEENCLVATKQFRRLSKRQKIILEHLRKEDGCMSIGDIANLCYIEEKGKGTPGNDFISAMTPEQHKAWLKSWECEMCEPRPTNHNWKFMSSIYRTMRELEKRDLVAYLVGREPTVWAWVDWSTGKPRLGRIVENRYINPDNKLWEESYFRSAHYQFGKAQGLSAKELKKKVKYYERLYERGLWGLVHYKRQARERGFLVDDKWIDE